MAAPAVVNTASGGRTGAGAIAITPPASSASYLAFVMMNGVTLTPPSGWTLVSSDPLMGSPNTFSRIYKGTAAAGSSWTVALDGTGDPTVVSIAVVGYTQDVVVGGLSKVYNNPTAPAVTAPADSLVLYGMADFTGAVSAPTYPSAATTGRVTSSRMGSTSEWAATTAVAHKIQSAAGSSGTGAWTIPSTLEPFTYTAYLTAAPSIPAPSQGAIVSIYAHQDDQAFVEPLAIEQNDAGTPMVVVVITAGDDNSGWSTFAQARERGMKASFASLAGVANPTWLDSTETLAGKVVSYSHLVEKNIRLYALRLPDTGNGSNPTGNCWALWEGNVASLATRDTGQTYTKAELTATLAAILDLHTASRVTHLNHREDGRDGDHPDHASSGKFARAAVLSSATKPPATAYVGEQGIDLPINLTTEQANRKEAAIDAYAAQTGENFGAEVDPWWPRSHSITEAEIIDPLPSASATVFGAAAPSGTFTYLGSGAVTVANCVKVNAGGSSKVVSLGARFYLPAGANAAAEGSGYFAHLWKANSSGVITEWLASAMFPNVVRGGWNSVQWKQPVFLAPGESYYISVTFPRGYAPVQSAKFASEVTSAQDSRILMPAASTIPQGLRRDGSAGGDRGFPPNPADSTSSTQTWWGIDGTFGTVAVASTVPPVKFGNLSLNSGLITINGTAYRLKQILFNDTTITL